MIENGTATAQIFTKTITICVSPLKVWDALILPAQMKQWMFEGEITIITEWTVGDSIIISGDMHGIPFENKGTVLQYEPGCIIAYDHLSSLSQLADEQHNYTVFEFKVSPVGLHTALTVNISNFPTDAIYRHMAFYWNIVPELLKKYLESTDRSMLP